MKLPEIAGEFDAMQYLGLCPCGQNIYANIGQGIVAHGIPHCKAFQNLEALEFVRYVRRSRGIPDPIVITKREIN